MSLYKEEIRKGITENNGQQNNPNEETTETKSENIKKVVTMVANEVAGYEEMRKRNDWYDEECQIKAEGEIKPESKCCRTTRTNTEN
jgi:hypothetical protein